MVGQPTEQISMTTLRKALRYLVVIAVLLVINPFRIQDLHKGGDVVDMEDLSMKNKSLSCKLCLKGYSSPSMTYSAGYNYEMLRRFAEDMGCNISIVLGNVTEKAERLFADSVDIVVLPYRDSLPANCGYTSTPKLDDGTAWFINGKSGAYDHQINEWMEEFRASSAYAAFKERFTPSYNPYTRVVSGKSYTNASPYDALFKKYAKNIGWDWRMLAVIVWMESKFHIELRSSMGAEGLMQMIPSTARHFGTDDMLDPEKNVAAGCNYLNALQKIFEPYAYGSELTRFTLAAYNAGEGRILDCIKFAKSRSLPYHTWRDIENVIPMMRDSTLMATDTTTRLGVFKGYETIAYIERMEALYYAFCSIAPEQSSLDLREQQTYSELEAISLSQDTPADPQPESAQD